MAELKLTETGELALDTLSQERKADDERSIFGFWLYIMTDGVLFASLFATYIVLHMNTFGGPGGAKLFEPGSVLAETMLLLTSSFTCGLAMLAMRRRQKGTAIAWLVVTALFGLGFLGIELHEFVGLATGGNSYTRSGFLSGFFTLVGTHGLHITIGLSWMTAMIIKLAMTGFTRANVRRLQMLSYFWHFLDVVWIFIFTVVYMLGISV